MKKAIIYKSFSIINEKVIKTNLTSWMEWDLYMATKLAGKFYFFFWEGSNTAGQSYKGYRISREYCILLYG